MTNSIKRHPLEQGKRKEFRFPMQVYKQFYLFRIQWWQILILLPPVGLGAWIYYLLPSSWALHIKALLSFGFSVPIAAMVFIKPFPERKNIYLYHLVKWRLSYNNRQKKFFYRKRRGESS